MNLLFIDIETTGLDPATDYILELGAVLYSSKEDKVLYEGNGFEYITPEVSHKLVQNPFVLGMHTSNGLIRDLNSWTKDESKNHISKVLSEIYSELENFEENTCMLAGSSVHFDVDFLRSELKFKNILGKLHHRRMDVSVFYSMWPDHKSPDLPESNHRALNDCARSLWIYRNFKSKSLI